MARSRTPGENPPRAAAPKHDKGADGLIPVVGQVDLETRPDSPRVIEQSEPTESRVTTQERATLRVAALIEEIREKKGKKQLVAIEELRSLVASYPHALDATFAKIRSTAGNSDLTERFAAALPTRKTRVAFLRSIAEVVDHASKEKRLSEEKIVTEVSDELNRRLAAKGVGSLSAFDISTKYSKLNSAALIGANTAMTFVNTMTSGAYVSISLQTAMGESVRLDTPEGVAFNVTCVLIAIGVLPITELLKHAAFFKVAANKAFEKQWEAKKQEVEEAPPPPKKAKLLSAKGALAALALATGAAGGVAVKTGTVILAEGANLASTATTFDQGAKGSKFVEEEKAAGAQIRSEVGYVLSDTYAGTPETMPPLIRDYYDNFRKFTAVATQNEMLGIHSESGGGSGNKGGGEFAGKKVGVIEGHRVIPEGVKEYPSFQPGLEWGIEQRKHFTQLETDEHGYPIVLKDAEGKPTLGPDGKEQYKRTPIEFKVNADGTPESLSDWIERRYAEFDKKAQAEFDALSKQLDSTDVFAIYLANQLTPVKEKVDLITRASIQSTAGFNKDVDVIRASAHRIDDMFRKEISVPFSGLSESTIAALRQISEKDSGMKLDAPVRNMDFSKLDGEPGKPETALKAPPGLTIDDLTWKAPEHAISLFTNPQDFLGPALLGGLFSFVFLTWAGRIETTKRRARKKADLMFPQAEQTFGIKFQEGDEYKMAKELGHVFRSFIAGPEARFNAPEFAALSPATGEEPWLFTDPKFMLYAMRRAAERAGASSTEEYNGVEFWPKYALRIYAKMMLDFTHATTEVPAVAKFENMRELYRNRPELVDEVFADVLPGFTMLNAIADRMKKIESEYPEGEKDRVRENPEYQKLSTAFTDTEREMRFKHLLARVQYAKTNIAYLNTAYDSLKEEGSFNDLNVGKLPRLPTLDFKFGKDGGVLSEDDKAKLDLVRKSGFRSLTIEEIERALADEEAALKRVDVIIDQLEKDEKERAVKVTTSFYQRLEELRRERESIKSIPAQPKKKTLVSTMSPRGATDRMNLEILESSIRARYIDEKLRARSGNSDPEKTYDADDQLKAINDVIIKVEEAVGSSGVGTPYSVFRKDHGLFSRGGVQGGGRMERFICEVTPEQRQVGYEGSIAEYYAIQFKVTEQGKQAEVYKGELPIQTIFSEGRSPDSAAKEIRDWVFANRNEISMNAQVWAMREDVAANEEEVQLPKPINLSASDSASRIDTLFKSTIPQERAQEELATLVKGKIDAVWKDFNNLDKLTNLRRSDRKKGKKKDTSIEPYNDLFDRLRKADADFVRIKSDRANPKPAFPDETRRVQAFIEFLKKPDNQRFLRQAKVSFEYVPNFVPLADNLQLTDKRALRFLTGNFQGRRVETSIADVMAAVENPSLSTDPKKRDAQRRDALLKLFEKRG